MISRPIHTIAPPERRGGAKGGPMQTDCTGSIVEMEGVAPDHPPPLQAPTHSCSPPISSGCDLRIPLQAFSTHIFESVPFVFKKKKNLILRF